MTLREKIARELCRVDYEPSGIIEECVEENWRDYLKNADAILSLLSDPANISDEMLEAFDRVFGPFAKYPTTNPNAEPLIRRAIAAAFTAAKESERP